MLKEIIYGKRQSGKTSAIIDRMEHQDNSILIVHYRDAAIYLQQKYNGLKSRIFHFEEIKHLNAEILEYLQLYEFKTFYFDYYVDWINTTDTMKVFLQDKNEIVVFDQYTIVLNGGIDGCKFTNIEKSKYPTETCKMCDKNIYHDTHQYAVYFDNNDILINLLHQIANTMIYNHNARILWDVCRDNSDRKYLWIYSSNIPLIFK